MDRKSYCKSLIGKKCIDLLRNNKQGIIDSIGFNSKDFEVCWFRFKNNKEAYLVSINHIEIIENKQLSLFE